MSEERGNRPHFVQDRERDKLTKFIYNCATEDDVRRTAARKSLDAKLTEHAVWRWHNFKVEAHYNHDIAELANKIHDNYKGGDNPYAVIEQIPIKDGKEDESQYYRPFSDVKYDSKGNLIIGPDGKADIRDYFPWDLRLEYPNGKKKYFDTKCTYFHPGGGFSESRMNLIREYRATATISTETSKNLIEKLYNKQSRDNSMRYGNGPRLFFCFLSLNDEIDDEELKIDENVREEAVRQLLNNTDILVNPSFNRHEHSIKSLNNILTEHKREPNQFDFVRAAIYYVIMDEDGVVHLIDGNK